MLTTNSSNDKLAAAHVDFASHGMLEGTILEDIYHQLGESHLILHLVSNSDDPPHLQVPPTSATDNELEEDGDGINDSHVIESHVMLLKTPWKCSLYLHASALY